MAAIDDEMADEDKTRAHWDNVYGSLILDHRFRKVSDLVYKERMAQNKKWGWPQDVDNLFWWMSILGEEFGEVCKEVNENNLPKLIAELVQVAAVAFAIIEDLDEKQVIAL